MERLGGFKEAFAGSKIRINIDHHKSNTYFGDLNYVDTEASSTCEIIYKIVGDMLSSLNNADYIAGCIYSGIVFDTGGFRHTSTSSITLAAASELIKYKFDFSKIYNTIFNTRKFEEAKALGRAILNMEKLAGGEIVYSSMSQEEIKSCGTESDGLSEIINYLKGISGCKAAVFVYEKSTGVFKVSMRSEDDVDVSAVAQSFGGGGHAKAAGCTVEGSKKEILDKIIVEISKQLT